MTNQEQHIITVLALTQRHYTRLRNAIKGLEKSIHQPYTQTTEQQIQNQLNKLKNYSVFDHTALIQSYQQLLNDYQAQSNQLNQTYQLLLSNLEHYSKAMFAHVRYLCGNTQGYQDRFLHLKPYYKHWFNQYYEPNKPLSLQQQTILLNQTLKQLASEQPAKPILDPVVNELFARLNQWQKQDATKDNVIQIKDYQNR